ncbi:MAG: hypothetical protein ACJASQ_003671 [Crocinitomicaceae bacterium]|jgi:hypothetical protein
MKSILVFFLVGISSFSYGQKEKFLSFELAGSGGIASINYESEFFRKEKIGLTYRLGFSFAPIDKNNGTALVFPLMVHGTYGKGSHRLDAGIGLALTVTTRAAFYVKTPMSLGYRFQPTDKNYYLRLAYTPIMGYIVDFNVQHWGGFTFGYKLNRK